jgi:hypothetical protein
MDNIPSIPPTSNLGTVPAQYNTVSGQVGNTQSQATNAQNQASASLNNLNSSIDNIKGKLANNDAYKQINQPKDFLKASLKTSFSRNQMMQILIPIIRRFAKTEYIANYLIKQLTKQTKEQLKNKGTLVVINGSFTFTPSNPGDYAVYKNNFDRKVDNMKKSLDKLQKIIDLLDKTTKTLNIALAITQILLKLKLANLNTKLVSISADLASPSPSKASGPLLMTTTNDILKYEKISKKIDKYQNIIIVATTYTGIFKNALSELRVKLDQLQFTITGLPVSPSEAQNLDNQLQDTKTSSPDNSEYTDNFGKSYILKLVTLPNGYKQYQALDAFSKLKITQTAPSKIKTPEQLFAEIKSILG